MVELRYISPAMNPKASPDLSQLDSEQFIARVAEGLHLVFENVQTLASDADFLCQSDRPRGGRILLAFAEEEASKILILLDAVRCPARTGPQKVMRFQHLKKFSDHVSKGIYIESSRWKASTFEEMTAYIARERDSLSLNSSDYEVWIERNRILQAREDLIYVSYVKAQGKNYWNAPGLYPKELAMFSCHVSSSPVINLVTRLQRCGLYSEAGLREIASIWHEIAIVPKLGNHSVRTATQQLLAAMNRLGLVNDMDDFDIQQLIDDWSYPLYTLELWQNPIGLAEIERLKRQAENDIEESFW
jgi:AbiV family abortive infection protein